MEAEGEVCESGEWDVSEVGWGVGEGVQRTGVIAAESVGGWAWVTLEGECGGVCGGRYEVWGGSGGRMGVGECVGEVFGE